jgi:uncharacterized protein YgiM (DUF1202 family)
VDEQKAVKNNHKIKMVQAWKKQAYIICIQSRGETLLLEIFSSNTSVAIWNYYSIGLILGLLAASNNSTCDLVTDSLSGTTGLRKHRSVP